MTKCEVKMAGYWPSSFFCVFMDRDEVEVHELAKKERGQYQAILTEQTWSIKDLLYGFWGNFACGIQRVVPSGQDGSILPARVANHSARFGSSCPLAEPAIYIIKSNINRFVKSGLRTHCSRSKCKSTKLQIDVVRSCL